VVVEAVDYTLSVLSGILEALGYAEACDEPFEFSSNYMTSQFHDRTGLYSPVDKQLNLDEFP
jgi:type I restriction enzyme R subunit